MRATDFETILPDAPVSGFPVVLRQTPSRAAPFILFALALPAAVLSLFPFVVLGEHLSRDPSLLIRNAGAIVALTTTGLLWLALFAWPIAVRIGRAATRREVEITSREVRVLDHHLLGHQSWSEPFHRYSGLTHRVRSSLSGTRHELILVHPNPARSVLVRASTRISATEIEATAAVFGCPEIAPRVIYRSTARVSSAARQELATAG